MAMKTSRACRALRQDLDEGPFKLILCDFTVLRLQKWGKFSQILVTSEHPMQGCHTLYHLPIFTGTNFTPWYNEYVIYCLTYLPSQRATPAFRTEGGNDDHSTTAAELSSLEPSARNRFDQIAPNRQTFSPEYSFSIGYLLLPIYKFSRQ